MILKTVKNYPGKNIVLVSHADPILAAWLSFEKKPLSSINKCCLKNASVTTLTFNEAGKFVGSTYNEITDAKKDMP
jgi:broad specificity phosphatase PhoE